MNSKTTKGTTNSAKVDLSTSAKSKTTAKKPRQQSAKKIPSAPTSVEQWVTGHKVMPQSVAAYACIGQQTNKQTHEGQSRKSAITRSTGTMGSGGDNKTYQKHASHVTKSIPSTSYQSSIASTSAVNLKLPPFPENFAKFKRIFDSKTQTIKSIQLDKKEVGEVCTFISKLETFKDQLESHSCMYAQLSPPGHSLYDKPETNVHQEQQDLQQLEERYKAQATRYEEKIQELTNKNSQLMHDRISQNETAFENVNARSRPSYVVEQIQCLSTDQWLTAKEYLDEKAHSFSDEGRTQFLTKVLLLSRDTAGTTYERTQKMVSRLLKQPVEAVLEPLSTQSASRNKKNPTDWDKPTAEEHKDHPLDHDLQQSITRHLKLMSYNVGVKKLAEEVTINLHGESLYDVVKQSEAMSVYIAAACRIAWLMAVQQPPMTFSEEGKGSLPSKHLHEIFFDCAKAKGSVISSFVQPIVMHGDKCLKKGIVYINKK